MKKVIMTTAGPLEVPSLRSLGFHSFLTPQAMLTEVMVLSADRRSGYAELRRQVMLKMIRQAHEAELAEPGEPPASAIMGTPEW